MSTSLDTQLLKVEAEAEAAADKATKLRAQRAELVAKAEAQAARQLEAENRERDKIATETLGSFAELNHIGGIPPEDVAAIDAAWQDFVQTVRDGGNDRQAWLEYRKVIAYRIARYAIHKSHLRRRRASQFEALASLTAEWSTRIADARNGIYSGYKSAHGTLATINREITEYAHTSGSTLTRPDDSQRPVMPEDFGLNRVGPETMPEPGTYDPRSYSQALGDALASVRKELEAQAETDVNNEIQLEIVNRMK